MRPSQVGLAVSDWCLVRAIVVASKLQIARVMTRTGSGWLDMALAKFKSFCTLRYIESATSAVTFDQFRASGQCPEPPHHNAWGALPKLACKAGYITATDAYTKASRPEAHARRVRVWSIQPEAL